MLVLEVVIEEGFDDETQRFVAIESRELRLEHSLVSLSKWESKWKKPFVTSEKTAEETLDYIRCMHLDEVDEELISSLDQKDIDAITEYINDEQTATVINESSSKKGGAQEIVTSEVLYHLMIAYQIPFECQHWHLNRLMTLIRVCHIRNQPEKKMSKRETLESNRELNRKRREMYNTKG